MKYLIVGLGNIGEEYRNTRHNAGFLILDAMASNIRFEDKRYGQVARINYKGRVLVLLKPSTYMNLSGNAVRYWMKKEKIPLENLLVLVDDTSLAYGIIRLRPGGGHGGHNGLFSIESVIGSQQYARLRFGIGDDFHTGQKADYVLGAWSSGETQQLPGLLEEAARIIRNFVTIGIDRTMSLHNKKNTDS